MSTDIQALDKNKLNPDSILNLMQKNDIEFIDFRFTDPKGKMHHISYDKSQIDAALLNEGVFIDGSSIEGWKSISDSDMLLKPDFSSLIKDPFFAQPTLAFFCDVLEPDTLTPYGRDPRSTAKKAETYMKSLSVADNAFFGPEAEFFLFDEVNWQVEPYKSYYECHANEAKYKHNVNNNQNLGHRPSPKGGYMPLPPVDHCHDIRAEMLNIMREIGINPEKHHHEVAPCQHELGIKYNSLVNIADNLQLYKYIVHQVAAAYGKTATFMPKPVYDDNGSGMHVHQSLWKDNKPVFAGNQYADLSKNCLYYIGGILKHSKAINALTNPTTNSYKRLVPGFEAPVLIAYSARNRSASIRIPFSNSPNAKRIEARFPDPTANPYLAFSALLMAGLDGIVNKIDPGDPIDKDLYNLPPEEKNNIPTMASSLEEALYELDNNRSFLTMGDVFTNDQIDTYIELKNKDVQLLRKSPHPAEFDLYYSS